MWKPLSLFIELINWAHSQIATDDTLLLPTFRTAEEASDALYRVSFYFPARTIYYSSVAPFPTHRPAYLDPEIQLSTTLIRVSTWTLWWKALRSSTVLVTATRGLGRIVRPLRRLTAIYDVDRFSFIGEAAAFYDAYNQGIAQALRPSIPIDFDAFPPKDDCFIFGTGPSLASAEDYDFRRTSSYRVVCNSIVKNRSLLNHIQPDFIVCADAASCFGPSAYSGMFRKDLVAYLRATPSCSLLIPEEYLAHFREHVYQGPRIYSIPRVRGDDFNVNIRTRYEAHNHGSVVNRLQLPLASSIARRVVLLGFDGRNKTESLGDSRWTSHSPDSNYLDLLDTVFEAHPHIRHLDKDAYATRAAAKTEAILSMGEKQGNRYYSLSPSSIPALQARQMPEADKELLLRRRAEPTAQL